MLTTSCAIVPPQRYPEFEDLHLRAHYVVPGDGRLQIPATTREIVVQQLELSPPPLRESFATNGTRYVHYDDGITVTLHGRFRSYRRGSDQPRTPTDLLPGADRIEVLPWNTPGQPGPKDRQP
ncbi:MAG: hypothetical protein NXI31_02430 [bacterium]|nr:hypothetical protein [bacterium]